MKKEIVMRQFSLEEFLGKPYQKILTRDGKPVRIICANADADRRVIALVRFEDGERACEYYDDGTRLKYTESENDLFFVTEKEVCLFKKGDRVLVRDSIYERWKARIFDRYNLDKYNKDIRYLYWCEGDNYGYKQCIPYNEHTWQLLNTTDEYKEK